MRGPIKAREWETYCQRFNAAREQLMTKSEFCRDMGIDSSRFQKEYKAWRKKRGLPPTKRGQAQWHIK